MEDLNWNNAAIDLELVFLNSRIVDMQVVLFGRYTPAHQNGISRYRLTRNSY